MIRDKERREEDLLQKIAGLAESLHKEKETNKQLFGEIDRQNESLTRMQYHFNIVCQDRDKSKLVLSME